MGEKSKRNSRREFLRRTGQLLLASGVAVPQALQAIPAMPNRVRPGGTVVSPRMNRTAIRKMGFSV